MTLNHFHTIQYDVPWPIISNALLKHTGEHFMSLLLSLLSIFQAGLSVKLPHTIIDLAI